MLTNDEKIRMIAYIDKRNTKYPKGKGLMGLVVSGLACWSDYPEILIHGKKCWSCDRHHIDN